MRFSTRRPQRPGIWMAACLAATIVLGGGCGDPGFSVSAVNRSDQALVIRAGIQRWALPAHASGYIFSTLGIPTEADATDYEILDASSCAPVGLGHVDFVANVGPVIVVGADRSVSVGAPDPSIGDKLAESDACPGPAGGWSLWIVNHTTSTFYLRSRAGSGPWTEARIDPTSGAIALAGYDETTTIELLDIHCQVLDTDTRTGWGDFKGTIDGTKLTITAGISPLPETGSYALTGTC